MPDQRDFVTRSQAGIDWYVSDDASEDGKVTIYAEQDMDDYLSHMRDIRNSGERFISKDKAWCLDAIIPPIIEVMWKNEGLDIHDPNHAEAFKRKLNDPDWAYLRTSTRTV